MTHIKHTALHQVHADLGAQFTDFGGWDMPLKYGSELAEHRAVRSTAGLFDLSHMGEIWVSGAAAAEFLNHALVGNLVNLQDGKAKYSLLCQADGGIIDDLICYRFSAERFLVVPNAGNAAVVAAELLAQASKFNVTVEDASARTSLLAVQGPAAEQILCRVLAPTQAAQAVTDLPYYAATQVQLQLPQEPVLVARTGYTGEDGFELFVANEHAAALWKLLLQIGAGLGLIPCGLAARDSLRLEAGMPLYGNELSREINPYEANLGGVVSLKKPQQFTGRPALEAFKAAGGGRVLVGLQAVGRRAARGGYRVFDAAAQSTADTPIGYITSGQPSPTLGYPIAMAYLEREHSALGSTVLVDLRGKLETFTVVALPFYKRASS